MAKFKALPDITHLNITEEERRLAELMRRRGKGSTKTDVGPTTNYGLEFLKTQTDDVDFRTSPLGFVIDLSVDFYIEWRVKYLDLTTVQNSIFGVTNSGYSGNFRLYHGKNVTTGFLIVGFGSNAVATLINPPQLDTWYKIRINYKSSDGSYDVLVGDLFQNNQPLSNTANYTLDSWSVGKSLKDGVEFANEIGSVLVDYVDMNGTIFNFPEGSGSTTKSSVGTEYDLISDRADINDMWINLDE